MKIALILILFVAMAYVLFVLDQKHQKYSRRVFAGLGMGILLGILIQMFVGIDNPATATILEWIKIPGQVYVRLLQMLVVPLIIVSLVGAFTKMDGKAEIGKISTHVLTVLMGTVMVAALVGILSILLFNLDGAEFVQGAQETARITALQEKSGTVADLTIPQQIISFFPSNIFEDFAGMRSTSTIAVVIFSAMVGSAYLGVARKQPEAAATFKKMMDALHYIVMRMVTFVLRLAPYGILSLMTYMVATSSGKSLLNMGTMLLASYFAFAVMFAIHGLIALVNGLSPMTFYRKSWDVLSFAFTSRSSAASMPLNISTQETAFGVDAPTANLAASLGMSIGQNGCAGIYPAMLVAIIAPHVGLDFSNPMTWISLILTIAISSFGVAGVGGGATFAALIVFGTLGLPIEIIGLMVSVEPVIDMGRTALNVSDSLLAGLVTAKRRHTLDEATFNDPSKVLVTE